nr:mucin-7-like [Aegilops tauschii subsp. strangulata]
MPHLVRTRPLGSLRVRSTLQPSACAARRASTPFRRCIAVRPRNGRLATRTPAHRAHLPLPALARAPGAPCASPLRASRASPVVPSHARHTAARPAGRARLRLLSALLRLALYSGRAPRLHCGLPPHFASQPPCCTRPAAASSPPRSALHAVAPSATCPGRWPLHRNRSSPAPPPTTAPPRRCSGHGRRAPTPAPCARFPSPVARPTKASVPLDRGARPQNI